MVSVATTLLPLLCGLTLPPVVTSVMTRDERQRMTRLERGVDVLTHQLMMLQLAQEEMRRSDGDSGIKQVRLNRDGTRPYHVNSHTGPSVASLHDHSNMPNTCGMGEVEAVLNGVHFRTRHNDFLLRMPVSSGEYHGTAAVPFPAVPPAVKEKNNLAEQVGEMREWFKAWRDGDTSQRDYRPYFKPVLCYLEGAWTTDVTLDEPFHSERHRLEASDLRDLHDKIRFTSHTGDKSVEENLAYLPTMILNVTDGVPSIAQWNYRILCHPLQNDVKLSDVKPLEELASRLSGKMSWEDYVTSRAARFSLNPFNIDKTYKWSVLDKLMKQIPGKNGYGARLTDKSLGGLKLHGHNNRPLNTAYYHRWYKLSRPGAMGDKVAHTGFADRNLFVAQTTQPRVAPLSVKFCRRQGQGRRTCSTYTRRVSYAMPLELVYLTPLHAWNPHRLLYKGDNQSPLGKTVLTGPRTGKNTAEGAYNGTNSRHFYQTPAQFFRTGSEVKSDPADTVKGVVGVLDPDGRVRSVVASGVRIFLPDIPGVGVVRTRYPIMPVYAEGSTVWKELAALRDVVMSLQEHRHYLRPAPPLLAPDTTATRRAGAASATDTDSNSKSSSKRGSAAVTGRGGTSRMSPLSAPNRTSPKQSQLATSTGARQQKTGPKPKPKASSPKQSQNSSITTNNIVRQQPQTPAPARRPSSSRARSSHVTLVTSPSTRSYVTMHVHTVEVSRTQLSAMVKRGKKVKARTTMDGGHSHLLTIQFHKDTQYFRMYRCDGRSKCWDGHSANLEKIQTSNHVTMHDILRRYG